MQERAIIHPRMMAMLTPDFYPSLCTLGTEQIVINSFGEEEKTWVADPTLTDLACRLAPLNTKEIRDPEQVFVQAVNHVSLAGYYPTINSDMNPQIDGKLWAMEGEPEFDGGGPLGARETRFFVREVT
jgi:hypothetical protein